jgi:hypothetical protein
MWKKFQLGTSYHAGDRGVKQYFFAENLILRKPQNKMEFRFFAKYFFFRRSIEDTSKYIYQWKPKNWVFRDRGSRKSCFSKSKHCQRKFFFRRLIEDTSKYIYQWKLKDRKNFYFHVRKGGRGTLKVSYIGICFINILKRVLKFFKNMTWISLFTFNFSFIEDTFNFTSASIFIYYLSLFL